MNEECMIVYMYMKNDRRKERKAVFWGVVFLFF